MTSVAPRTFRSTPGDNLPSLLESGIDSVVLLGGTVRQTELRRAVGRHILQLPIDASRTILGRWAEQVGTMATRVGVGDIRVRIVLSPDEVFDPVGAGAGSGIVVETDPNPTRGTGGVLRDLAESIPDDRWLLVANANQAFVGDPLDATRRLAALRADMALMPAADGNGGFLLLTRAGCLKGISPRGFVDLKEQALPAIASRFDVRVVDADPQLTPTSIRSLRDYLELLLGLSDLKPDAAGAPVEDWAPVFRIIEEGARVSPEARVHNSVILAGATVEAGAVVARCVVGPGTTVRRGEVVRDRAVGATGSEEHTS